MKNFFIRLLSGVSAAVLFTAAILFSYFTYGLAILLAASGAMYEFYGVVRPLRRIDEVSAKKMQRTAILLTVAAMFFSLLLNLRNNFADMAVILPAILLFYFIRALFSRSENPFQDIAWDILPVVYILVPVMLLNYLYCEKQNLFVIAILFMIWFFDSMCYICGSLFGRTKLFERISPKKTVEGLIGGMILTLALVFFYDRIINYLVLKFHFLHSAAYTYVQWLIIGIITLIFATFGDLIESQLKRSSGLKDSGAILPGHGGFLDRLDSVLIAIPFTVLAVFVVDRINDLINILEFLK